MPPAPSSFCFQPSLFKFLKQLEKNNNRDWFNDNKPRYEKELLAPSLEFIAALEKPFKKKVSPHFNVISKRTGGSLMRIYRDTRFSKDKTPYKTNVGIHIRHEFGKDVHAPGFYFHISPNEIFVGAGVWHPDNKALNKIRFAIVENDRTWRRITKAKKLTENFEQHGDSLKRPPRDFDAEHPLIDELKRKDHIVLANLSANELQKPGVVEKTIGLFAITKPYVRFLCDALKQPF